MGVIVFGFTDSLKVAVIVALVLIPVAALTVFGLIGSEKVSTILVLNGTFVAPFTGVIVSVGETMSLPAPVVKEPVNGPSSGTPER